jgi:acyl-CoA synthetase (AMP-forming)/AMP-acid ligase II
MCHAPPGANTCRDDGGAECGSASLGGAASQEFTSRFNIRQIGEFYGSTEGNVIFFNYWRKGEPMGAIGA